MAPSPTELVEEYLLVWVLAAVALGVANPEVAVVTRASTPILAVMIASVSLTLSVERFRGIDRRGLAFALLGHLTMPLVAAAVARGLGLSPALTLGFVVVGAVTPELVTPVMTELAGGDTALATTTLVITGVGSLAVLPAMVGALTGGPPVPTAPIVEGLALAVVLPMVVAVGLRAWQPDRVGAYDEYYPSVAGVMVVLIIGGVAGANASLVRSDPSLTALVGVGALTLNLAGYAVGYGLGSFGSHETRIATVLSVGMRDFAVAAAVILAAGLPTVASLPAIAFGIVEMTTSAALARYLSGS